MLKLKLLFSIREELDLEDPLDDLPGAIVDDILHDVEVVRKAASETISQVLEVHSEFVPGILQQLLVKYEEKLYVSAVSLCLVFRCLRAGLCSSSCIIA